MKRALHEVKVVLWETEAGPVYGAYYTHIPIFVTGQRSPLDSLKKLVETTQIQLETYTKWGRPWPEPEGFPIVLDEELRSRGGNLAAQGQVEWKLDEGQISVRIVDYQEREVA